jgi:hypothetical protein
MVLTRGSLVRFAPLFLAVIFLAGCVSTEGRDFKSPDLKLLMVGGTSPTDVRTLYGEPFSQSINSGPSQLPPVLKTPNNIALLTGSRESIRYYYKRGLNSKSFTLLFVDGKLADYAVHGNFPELSTDFDETKVPLLIKGKTQKSEVIALLGLPSGVSVFPAISERNETMFHYSYSEPTLPSRLSYKRLDVRFDSNDTLLDFNFQKDSGPIIRPLESLLH